MNINTELLKSYGIYDGLSFMSTDILTLGFEVKDDVVTILDDFSLNMRDQYELEFFNIFSTRSFFKYYKIIEKKHKELVLDGLDYFEEIKSFYRERFGITECFDNYEHIVESINKSLTMKYGFCKPITFFDDNYLIKQIFDYIDICIPEIPHVFFDYKNKQFIITFNITNANNWMSSIPFDWKTLLKKYFNVSEDVFRELDRGELYFDSNSDVIQFLMPLDDIRILDCGINIIFNGKNYLFYWDCDKRYFEEKIATINMYYYFRFCKTFYLITNKTPYEWVKEQMCFGEEFIESDLLIQFKYNLPYLKTLHRQILSEEYKTVQKK